MRKSRPMKDQLHRQIYPAIKIRHYIKALGRESVSDDQLFLDTGLDREKLDDPDTKISMAQEQKLI